MSCSERRIRPFGEFAFLVEVTAEERHQVAEILSAAGLDGVVDVVPAEATVLVRYREDPLWEAEVARAALIGVLTQASRERPGQMADGSRAGNLEELVVPVCYDGPDLGEVAELTGLTVEDVIAVHSAGRYTVAFLGFAPGFAYLDGLSPALAVPRRATPRTRVEEGAIGVAGRRTCVYPWSSPGGWRIIGHTAARLFDPAAEPPTPLVPGRRVRFEVEEQ